MLSVLELDPFRTAVEVAATTPRFSEDQRIVPEPHHIVGDEAWVRPLHRRVERPGVRRLLRADLPTRDLVTES